MDDFNLYEELALDVTITDSSMVLKAIDDKIKWYNQRVNNPKYSVIGVAKKKQLTALKKQINESPVVIQQHAMAYAEIAKKREIEVRKRLQEEGSLYVVNGLIAEANLRQLVTDLKMSEDEILRLLNAKVKKPKTFKYKDDGVKELDSKKMKTLNELLSILGKKNLYEFLGTSSSAKLADLQVRLAKVKKDVDDDSNKTDPKLNATDKLAKECTAIFANEEARKSYDKACGNAGFETVRTVINQMKAGVKIISPQQYKQMLGICTKNGVPFDIAEYLIYDTAKKAGLEIEEGNVSTMAVCRYCGGLNDKTAKTCGTCGMPVNVVCPKCGHPAEYDDYRCSECGFSLIDMQEAPLHLKIAEAALEMGDVEGACREFDAAVKFWPTCPDLNVIGAKIKEYSDTQQHIRQVVAKLCAERKYCAAMKEGAKLAVNDRLRIEAEKAIADAEQLVKQAEGATDDNVKFENYLKALSLCADYQAALVKLNAMPLPVPTGLTALVKGNVVALSWTRCKSSFLSYLVVRKENAKSSSFNDGVQLNTTQENYYDDVSALPERSYYYTVYSKFGDRVSAVGATISQPVLKTLNIEPQHIKVNPSETQLEFSFTPSKRSSIEITRLKGETHVITGGAFVDKGLVTGQAYTYIFVAIYTDSAGNIHRSEETSMQFTPMPKPQPVDIVIKETEDKAMISWDNPKVGRLAIFYADEPFKYNKNDLLSIDTLKAARLNVTGTSCTVNKDFSGERFFMPVTIQDTIGVAGTMVSIVSLQLVSDLSVCLIDKTVQAKWKWDNCAAIRISYSIDSQAKKEVDLERDAINSATYEIKVPEGSRSISLSAMSLVKTSSKVLLGPPITKVLNLKPSKVQFVSVTNLRRLLFLSSNEYEITFISDSLLPCDLHVLASESTPPMNLVNYSPVAIIKNGSIKVGKENKIRFNYARRNNSAPLFFRLIAADRTMANLMTISSEIQQIK